MSAECSADAKRIISLGGTVTEIIYALGEEDRLVGVDTTSTYPTSANTLPKLGYYRAVAAEGLLSLGPDLIVADADAGPDETLKQIEAAGVCVRRTPDGGDVASVISRVEKVAEFLGVETKGADITIAINTATNAILSKVDAVQKKPRVLFLLSANTGTPVAAGRGTEADAIIRLAGGVNAGDGISGYKPLTPEAAIAAEPDFILMMEHVVRQVGGKDKVLRIPQIALTPAGQNRQLIAMDGLLLLGFGPRTPDAINDLANQIHPNFEDQR
jgi:iron complex transport system substrate-binding protein